MKVLRICLLSYRSNPSCGGQGVYIQALSKYLSEIGHKVTVISGSPYPILDDRVELIKLPGFNLMEKRRFFPEQPLDIFLSRAHFTEWLETVTGRFAEPKAFAARVFHYLKANSNRFDIVHDNQTLADGTLKLQSLPIPLVTTIHHPISIDLNCALKNEQNRFKRLFIKRWYSFVEMQRRIAPQLNNIITVTSESKKSIMDHFQVKPDSISVFPIGIDTDLFKPQKVMHTPFELMSFASTKNAMKGLRFLLLAFKQLKEKYNQLRLTLITQPDPQSADYSLLKSLGLEDCIIFKPDQTPQQLVDLYNQASMLVIPSLYEGFGIPALEAMACETPVVATTGGGLKDVVQNHAVLAKPGCVKSLAASIEIALMKRDVSAVKHARAYVDKTYSWKVIAENLTHYYERLC